METDDLSAMCKYIIMVAIKKGSLYRCTIISLPLCAYFLLNLFLPLSTSIAVLARSFSTLLSLTSSS